MTLFLIDANVLIRAEADYYPCDRIPQFWEWLEEMSRNGRIKIPKMILAEIVNSSGPLSNWLKDRDVYNNLLLTGFAMAKDVEWIKKNCYASDLTDTEVRKIGNDPYLLAEAYVYNNTHSTGNQCVVVTKEVSKPSKKRQNRRIPDICKELDIRCINDFKMYKELDFRVN